VSNSQLRKALRIDTFTWQLTVQIDSVDIGARIWQLKLTSNFKMLSATAETKKTVKVAR
jgi:hypothetical protein